MRWIPVMTGDTRGEVIRASIDDFHVGTIVRSTMTEKDKEP